MDYRKMYTGTIVLFVLQNFALTEYNCIGFVKRHVSPVQVTHNLICITFKRRFAEQTLTLPPGAPVLHWRLEPRYTPPLSL